MAELKNFWPLILTTIIVSVNMEQAGIVTGWSSPVLTLLESENSPIPTTPDEGSWITTILPLSSFFCTIIASISTHYLGRKPTIGLTTIPYLVSWVIISFASTTTELLIARSVAGLSLAMSFVAIPVYLGEISPDNLRGRTGLFVTAISCFGILRIYCIGNVMSLWLSSLISAFPLLLVIIFYKWLPESPYYLIKKNCWKEAEASLKKLRNSNNVDEELKKIELTIMQQSQESSFKDLFLESNHRRALIISLGVMTFAHCTGGVTFLFYAHIIFQKAGSVSANTMSIIKAVLQVFTCLGSTYLVEKTGKKPLLIISCIGATVFMTCEGIYFYLHDSGYNVDAIWWLPLASMVLYNISQIIGLGPISIAYLGELFHPKVKSVAVCISKMYMAFTIFVIGKIYQVMSDALGNWVPFFVFACVGIFGAVFVVLVVPETKGKSLNDIQYYMQHKKYQSNTKPLKN